jgi:hypothetical protein
MSGGAMCGLHHAHRDKEREFLGWASKPRSMVYHWFNLKTTRIVYQWFDLKTTGTVFFGLTSKSVVTVFSGLTSKPVATIFSGLVSKPVARVSRFGPQNWQLRFGDLDLKITTKVSWFES